MATLHKNRYVSFQKLRDALGLTEGNLGAHVQKLREAGYVESRETLTARGFEVHYSLTRQGTDALLAYIADLQRILSLPPDSPTRSEMAAPDAAAELP